MENIVDTGRLFQSLENVRVWFLHTILTLDTLIQVPVIAIILVFAFFLARLLRSRAGRSLTASEAGTVGSWFAKTLLPLAFPLTAMILMWLVAGVSRELGWSQPLTRIVAALFTAWVGIRLASNVFGATFWTRFLSLVIWLIAALAIVELLDPTIAFLDSIAVTVGGLRISALTLVKAFIVLGIALWLAGLIARFAERRLEKSRDLSPAIKVLTGKLVRIGLVTLALVIGLTSVGIDLSGLAIFSGAVGLGIGLGLQRIVSNLVSGVILLMDKSIKPGDVLQIGDTYGWIKSLSARYVSILTRDGTEHLIPNEMLITDRVINWSFSNNLVRMKLSVGISYSADVRKAIALCLDAVQSTPRVIKHPEPVCFIHGFGESAVDLSLRFWISDPENGTGNVQGAVYLAIWDRFRENAIEIPFPQRDVHIRSAPSRTSA